MLAFFIPPVVAALAFTFLAVMNVKRGYSSARTLWWVSLGWACLLMVLVWLFVLWLTCEETKTEKRGRESFFCLLLREPRPYFAAQQPSNFPLLQPPVANRRLTRLRRTAHPVSIF